MGLQRQGRDRHTRAAQQRPCPQPLTTPRTPAVRSPTSSRRSNRTRTLTKFEGRGGSIDLDELRMMIDSNPVKKLLNLVLLQAIKDRASDIHFEPFEDEFKMRYRIDGVLYEMVPPPRHIAYAISSRIKVMANLDIAERAHAPGRPHPAASQPEPGRPARQRPADHVRRERRAPRAGPVAVSAWTWRSSACARTTCGSSAR